MPSAASDRRNMDQLSFDDHDVDIMGRTIWGEARGETAEGQTAVAWVIRNRAERAQFAAHQHGMPGAVAFVCLRPYQFSCWNESDPNRVLCLTLPRIPGVEEGPVFKLAQLVLAGSIEDVTRGADHYCVTDMPDPPEWASQYRAVREIGRHTFFDSRSRV